MLFSGYVLRWVIQWKHQLHDCALAFVQISHWIIGWRTGTHYRTVKFSNMEKWNKILESLRWTLQDDEQPTIIPELQRTPIKRMQLSFNSVPLWTTVEPFKKLTARTCWKSTYFHFPFSFFFKTNSFLGFVVKFHTMHFISQFSVTLQILKCKVVLHHFCSRSSSPSFSLQLAIVTNLQP